MLHREIVAMKKIATITNNVYIYCLKDFITKKHGSLLASLIFISLLSACGGNSSGNSENTQAGNDNGSTPTPTDETCSLLVLEDEMDSILSQIETDADFSFAIERADGLRYRFNRGDSTLSTSYKSASSSKLITAVIILRLVEQNFLQLNDRPQDHINNWPISSNNSLYGITLSQLLSFTSGLEKEPLCLNLGFDDFERCVIDGIVPLNQNNGLTPGERYYYASTHMQVAGLMAIKARGISTWSEKIGRAHV